MMVCITTWCPECGCVELGNDDVTLVMSPSDPSGYMAWYAFDCVGCVEQVVKPATSSVVSALTRAHVAVSIVPSEVVERTRSGERPPLTTNDLLDAMLWLRTYDVPGTALTLGMPPPPP